MRPHALLSPSSASRWMKCTPSARLEERLPERSSVYADEGTVAHKLGELIILMKLHMIRRDHYKTQLANIKATKYYNRAMQKYCDAYAAYVIAQFNRAKKLDPQAMIFIETNVSTARWIPQGYGTADILIVGHGFLWFIDLKYGEGVPVMAFENKQLMIYALGALDLLDDLVFMIKAVALMIYQPRIGNIDIYETSADDLYAWGEAELAPIASEAFEGKGRFVAGKHCQFCLAKAQCKAHASYHMSLAKLAFGDPATLSDADVVEVLNKYETLVSWARSVAEYALAQAVAGKKWKGYKVVAGRSNRKITDLNKAYKILRKAGYTDKELMKPAALKGITELESLLSAEDFAYYLNKIVDKPYGSPTLVSSKDTRPPYDRNKAAKDTFTNL